jgi:uncharacterized protein YdaT
MPWTPGDGPARHTHRANTPATKKQWSDIANKVLAKSGDEASAIKIANSQVKKHPSHKGEEGFGLAKGHGG